MSIAACDVSIAPVDLSIVHEALSTCPDEVSIALRVWITICRRRVIDTSPWGRCDFVGETPAAPNPEAGPREHAKAQNSR